MVFLILMKTTKQSTTDPLFSKVLSTLNESQKRWYVAREAINYGRGGIKITHELTGISRPTIIKGMQELKSKKELQTDMRIRSVGGGRKNISETAPEFEKLLKKIMDEITAGDPMSLLRWTNKSVEGITELVKKKGCNVSRETVRKKLLELDYSLQSNFKSKEGFAPEDRNEQFEYINSQIKKFIRRGDAVLSIDAKKKEKVGEFKNNGRSWHPKGRPTEVNVYDYPSLSEGKAIPYGAYDIARNTGFVNVGMTHETAEFAVYSLRRWWRYTGEKHYPALKGLLLCADGGSSNGKKNRAWKYYLQEFSNELEIPITVCHYPRGTSKWNKIEHRMFSYISLHWKGEPLVSYETIVNLISKTRTKTGLRIKAKLDRKKYKTGRKVSDVKMDKINLSYHKIQPDLNYTIYPTPTKKK